MDNFALFLECCKCGREFSVDSFAFRCLNCNEPLEVVYDYDFLKSAISKEVLAKRQWSLWRYWELLPAKAQRNIVTLGEGGTPLIRSTRLSRALSVEELYFKDEGRNPTGSFKDRGSSVGVSKALEVGAGIVGCASTGNMAASLSAYAAKAGLKCVILIPHGTPVGKVLQTLYYEPITLAVDLPYPELYRMSFEMAKEFNVYLVHSDSPMRVEGQKTVAFEICEQLDWRAPDIVVVPTSSGGNFSAIWKGFKEFYELDLIDKLPRMVCVQSEGCAPIVEAFKNRSELKPWPKPQTIAHSISNPNPILASGRRVLKILDECEGLAIAVSDEEILEAQKQLAVMEGLFVEPASAATVAGLKKLVEESVIDRDEKVVCVLTGLGLKDTEVVKSRVKEPISVKSWSQFREILGDLMKSMKAAPSTC